MKQVLQDLRSHEVRVAEVPVPARREADLLIATRRSVISPGTDRATLELAAKSLLGKAQARPDIARKVIEAARAEGISSAVHKVRGRIDEPFPLGYSSCGVVIEAPSGSPVGPGALVACAGARAACHAEVVAVPRTLCAKVPDGVEAEDAAYATLCAIAIHGVRLSEARLGDVVAVIGLGLIGQLAMEILSAAGCVALGVDPDEGRVALAREREAFATSDAATLGAESRRLTDNRGADAVVLAAASRSADPLMTAVESARDRAVVSIVGDVPVESPRSALFAKELRIVVSRSYGPGRYDPVHEEKGIDYPASYVRWTEGRNLAEALRLMGTGALKPSRFTTHRFPIAEGARGYEVVADPNARSMGIVLEYPETHPQIRRRIRYDGRATSRFRLPSVRPRPRVGVIGAGTFARTVLLPALSRHADFVSVATTTPVSGQAAARRFLIPTVSTDPRTVIEDESIDAVVIATRHDTHAEFAAQALRARKHVLVEKPLAIDEDGLAQVEAAATAPEAGTLTVGFNRRFAPHARTVRDELGGHGPLLVSLRVNAGRLPGDHWVHDPAVGGGRIVGEVCHFIDLAAYLCDEEPVAVSAFALEGSSEPREDSIAASIQLSDGSAASIAYSALGDVALAKERIEVLGERGAATIDDFREVRVYRNGRERIERSRRDKGHRAVARAFAESCRSGASNQELSVLFAVTRTTLELRAQVLAGYRRD